MKDQLIIFLKSFGVSAQGVFCQYSGAKSVGAGIGMLCMGFISNQHVIIAMAFMLLVVMDLFTKQMSIGAQYAARLTGRDIHSIDTMTKIQSIFPAFYAGEIRSLLMRKPFLDKMEVYFISVLCAKAADVVIVNTPDAFVLNLMYSYLGATEFLSILENLRDGGNATMAKLVTIAETKIMNRLK